MKDIRFFKCPVCGAVDAEFYFGGGPRACCNKPMTELVANTTDAATEKHVPVIKRDGNTVTVDISTVEHPMIDEHYITFIAIVHGNKIQKAALTPEDKPTATFTVDSNEDITAYEYCNIHGLWSSK